MTTSASWYSDPDSVLAVLRQDSEERVRLPRLTGYDIVRELGRGGQGVVYLATQRSTRRPIALKVLLDGVYASSASRRRFDRELDLIVGLRHPGIVLVHDSGVTADDRPYIVMEYIEGVRLDRHAGELRAARGRDAVRPLLELFAEVCDAVAFAHQRGVIHRDLKPGNILIDGAGAPHVCDFGLAKSMSDGGGEASLGATSMPGRFLGSLPWAAPEQFDAGGSHADVRTDVYALGVMLVQMLTDRFPYDVSGGMRQVIDHILNAAPIRPSGVAAGLDDEIDTIALKCLAKEPAHRYQSAAELVRDVRRYLAGEPIEAKRDSGWYTLRKALRRHRTAVALSSAALLLLIATTTVALVSWRNAVQARNRAISEAGQRAAIDGFLQRMLTSVDPAHGGRDVRLLDVINRAAAEAPIGASDQPQVAARIHGILGASYSSLGMYEAAERQFGRGFDLLSRALGPDSREALELRVPMAGIIAARGRVDEAEHLARETLAGLQRVAGDDDEMTLQAMSRLGHVLNEGGKSAEAERRLRAALDGQRRTLGVDHDATLTTMDELAVLLRRAGKVNEAESVFREALEHQIRRVGTDDPGTLSIQNNYALALHASGKLDDAERLYRAVMDARLRILGDAHPDTAASMSNLATLLLERRKPAEAEPILRQSIDAYVRALGDDNPATLTAVNNLAKALQDLNRLDEAEAMFRRVLDARRRVSGSDHPSTLLAAGNLGSLLALRGRTREAIELHTSVLEARRRTLGEAHFDTLVSMNNVGMLMQKSGDLAEAESHFRRAVDNAEKALPAGHFATALFRGNLGRCLMALGRMDEARKQLAAATESLQRAFGMGDPRTVQNVESLLDVLTRSGQADEAAAWRAKLNQRPSDPSRDREGAVQARSMPGASASQAAQSEPSGVR